jgi:GTPase
LSTFGAAAAALAEAAATGKPGLLTLPPEVEDDDVRVAMIGNVDSGKSTLIGVLTHAALDDGRGSARKLVLKHRHEQENGRTSAVTVELMGYTEEGTQVVPTARHQANRWAEICSSAARSVTLIDLCGHERYLKTTVFGLTGAYLCGLSWPVYMCLHMAE